MHGGYFRWKCNLSVDALSLKDKVVSDQRLSHTSDPYECFIIEDAGSVLSHQRIMGRVLDVVSFMHMVQTCENWLLDNHWCFIFEEQTYFNMLEFYRGIF